MPSEGKSPSSQVTRKIVIGVAGGIAAYKACHLIRAFKELGDEVRVIPTAAALKFVGSATFEALSGNPVSTDVFDAVDQVQHVRIGQEADLIVIVPATADLMARLTAGRSDDLLSATVLVATCPVVIAPAMHTEMWLNPATVFNVKTLRSRGYTVIEPAHGRLTGADSGPGRLPDPEQIVEIANAAYRGITFEHNLAGKKVVITAGGTQEHIDPVRFVGNSSSGRQGYALAEIAVQRGAEVTLISGNTVGLATPSGAKIIDVVSAQDMFEAVQSQVVAADIVIMAAAVADFRPDKLATAKLKKGETEQGLNTIHLVENPDILANVVAWRSTGTINPQSTILGFAAETGDESTSALDYAQAKLARKGCDLLMCNEVGRGKVFGERSNQGWILDRLGGVTEVSSASKLEVAAQLVDAVVHFRDSSAG